MATFGDNGSGGTYFFDDTGNSQFWDKYGNFPGGIITDVWAYFAGDGAAISANLLVWKANSIIVNAGVSVGSGSRAVNGQAWQHAGGLSVYCAPTNDFGIGWWSAGHVVWTGNGGFAYFRRTASPTGAGSFDGTEGASPHAYVVYTPVSAPTISSVAPSVATTGQSVVITGTQFTYASSVTINGASASFTINADTQITATVPAGATPGAGTIVVTNPAGSASIAFTIGQIFYGDPSGNGTTHSIVAVWYGDPSGNGTPHKAAGVWVPTGGPPPTGVKRVW